MVTRIRLIFFFGVANLDVEEKEVDGSRDDVQQREDVHVDEEQVVLGLEHVELRSSFLQHGQQGQGQRQQEKEEGVGNHLATVEKERIVALCPHTPKHIRAAGQIILTPANQCWMIMEHNIRSLSNPGFKPATFRSLAERANQTHSATVWKGGN
jgi:hypothetical protein